MLEHESDDGEAGLPVASAVGADDDRASLIGKLASADIKVDLPFIYSAFHDDRARYVYYLGELRSIGDAHETRRLHFHDFDSIPWERIPDPAVRSMLERFIREQNLGYHAIYIGDAAQGEIFPA